MIEIPAEWKLLLPHENADDYRHHVEGMVASHQPENAYETWLVEEFAAAAWCYRRARSIEASFLEDIGGSYNRGPAGVAQALFQEKEARLRNYLRFRAQAEREYNKALAAVERMRRDRDRRGGRKLETAGSASKTETAAVRVPEAAMTAGNAVSAAPVLVAKAPTPAGTRTPETRKTAKLPAIPSQTAVERSPRAAHAREKPEKSREQLTLRQGRCYPEPVSELA